MAYITPDSLMTLEAYAKARAGYRAEAMLHKQKRKVALGDHVTLLFEDELTIRYQIQEILRVEKVFEEGGIREELEAYNPLIPDGSNWKATMLIEYPDVDERSHMLKQLKGIERQVWVEVAGSTRVYAVADEDMQRENAEKTSAVHFLRFELDAAMRKLLRNGADIWMGVDHPLYTVRTAVMGDVRSALLNDFAD